MPGKFSNVRMHSVNLAVCSAILLTPAFIASPSLHAQTTYQVIHQFTPATDGSQPNGLARDAGGNLFGTATQGGSSGFGTVFKLDSTTHAFTVLHTFTDTPDGATPEAPVTLDPAGNLYGTTAAGGSGSGHGAVGTVFKIDPTEVETIVHSFVLFSDGAEPAAKLIRDSGGNLYGTTLGGGHGFDGTVFRINKFGTERLLYQFNQTDGADPRGIARDSAGNLYGTTVGGTANPGHGTVYKLAPDGTHTILHSFTGGADGDSPLAEPLLDVAGNLYSTTLGGGDFGKGTVFKIDTAGNFTVVHSFSGSDGAGPEAGLVMDAAGNFYGTTFAGGDFNLGVVFKVDSTGNETVLHSFAGGADGSAPTSTPLLTSDGTLFGSCSQGGLHDGGTLFKLKP
jgi:uncharacterized repeat protein (TIGR03803 family)